MKKLLLFFAFTLAIANAQEQIRQDSVTIGKPSSASDKVLSFDTADGASNPKLSVEKVSKKLKYDKNSFQLGDATTTNSKEIIFNGDNKKLNYDGTANELQYDGNLISIGDGTATDKILKFNKGASSPSIKFNSTKSKLEFSNDNINFKAFGAGAGGAGAISILENNGFEDGIDFLWTYSVGTVSSLTTGNQLVNDISARFDPVTQNDFLRTSYITTPRGLRGSACEARFLYKGGDVNIYAKVETESGIVLGQYQRSEAGSIVFGLQSLVSAGYESVYFKCPTQADIDLLATNGNIRLVFYQGTVTNGAATDIDDIHFGGLIGLTEVTTPDSFSAKVSSAGVVSDENVDWINGNCTYSAGDWTCPVVSGTFSVVPNCVVVQNDSTGANTVMAKMFGGSTTTSNIHVITQLTTANTASQQPFNIICNKQGVDAKQTVQVFKSIPKIAANENRLSAVLNGTTCAIVSQFPNNWITSTTDSGTGNCLVTYSGLGLSSVPSIAPGVQFSGGTLFATVSNPTVTEVNLHASNVAGALADPTLYFVTITKQGSDAKMATVQPIITGQVTNSAAESALVNVRTESCRATNGGAAAIDTASGLCGGWATSVTRTGLGTVAWVLNTGIFSSVPTCTCGGENGACTATVASTTSVTTQTYSGTGSIAAFDSNVTLKCKGKR